MYPIDFFYRASLLYPDRIALQGPHGIAISYRELVGRVDSLAHAIQTADGEPQARVGICATNHADHVIALLATLAAGKTWVPLNAKSTPAEIRRILDAVTPCLIISDQTGHSLVTHPGNWTHWTISGANPSCPDIHDLMREHAGCKPTPINASRDATQAIKFTGGTTGAPKGVMQPYRAWTAGIINQIHGWQLSADDVFVVTAPVTHGTSTYLLPILGAGGKLVFPDAKDPPGIAAAFREHTGTISFMPPTLIYMLMAHPDVHPRDFASLRNLVYGGAPMPAEKVEEAIQYFGPVIGTTYGQTEAPQIVTMLRSSELADSRNRGSAGRCTWLSDMAIMAPDGTLVPCGEKGEVVVRGDLVMTGYWGLPDKTEQTIVDGWLHTGDVGYIDERGFLFIKDRIRDVIITGGFNVYPVDVENALSKHPCVHESSVFGMPDPKWGEAVHAAVQLRTGHQATAEELTAHVKTLLGSVHTPKHIHFFNELPRSSVGKVLKKDIKDQLTTTNSTP